MLEILGELLVKIITKPDPSQLIGSYGWAGASCLYVAVPLVIGFAAYLLIRNNRKKYSKKA